MRRAAGIVGLLVLIAVLAVGGFLAVDRLAGEDESAPVIDKPELGRAAIQQADLIETETYPAVLRFADPDVITVALGGTVTAVVEEGTTLSNGSWVVEVDGQPVYVMDGTRPMWRPLALPLDGSELKGADVLQLEENLLAMGYPTIRDEEEEVPDISEADEVFDEDTVRLIEDWREDVGLSEGGFVELGRIVFLDRSVRVAEALAPVSSFVAPGTPVLSISAPGQEVFLQLDVAKRDQVAVGDTVDITLPDDTITTGTVESVGSAVTYFDPDSPGVIDVSIVLDEPAVGAAFDESPVDVEIISNQVLGALAVPVNALLALAEGGYALEVEQGGTTRLVAVETGIFVDGLVEIRGDVAAGDMIVVPK